MTFERKHVISIAIVLLAVLLLLLKYRHYLNKPWTRDGQVRAEIIQITPRVTGPIIELAVRDNQFVAKGDLLFRIDPRTFAAQLNKMTAQELRTQWDYERAIELVKRGDTSERNVDKATAAYDIARAEREAAQLDLEFTHVYAPVDGYVTNLNLQIGSQAVANQPALALIDSASYYVEGFFRENSIAHIQSGDAAVVTLMSYPETPLEGTVDSIGWGIAQDDGSTSHDLLPSINPTFSWIRLAQRVPVRVQLQPPPASIQLRVGTTASVLVHTGTAEHGDHPTPVAAPALLQ